MRLLFLSIFYFDKCLIIAIIRRGCVQYAELNFETGKLKFHYSVPPSSNKRSE